MGGRETVQVGKEGDSMWETASEGNCSTANCTDACAGRSPRGQRAGWERSAAVRRGVASSCLSPTVFVRADSLYCST